MFYLAGADPYEGERWGRLRLTLKRRDAIVLQHCATAGVPVAISMAGGYARDIDAIVTIHTNTIRTAADVARSGRSITTTTRQHGW